MPTEGTKLLIPKLALPEFLWKRCREFGDKVATMDNAVEDESFTFEEVYRKSKNVSAFLLQMGAKTGDVIGLCAPNSSAYMIAMLGIMGCGATIAPLSPTSKEGEILQRFGISEPKMVIVDERDVETMKNLKAQLSSIEEIFVIGKSDEFTTLNCMSTGTVETDSLENVKINPSEDVAMLPCSSGTTGLPKCVMLTHYNLIAMMCSFLEHSKWTSGNENVLYMDRPMYNISGIFDVILCLTLGMKGIVETESGSKRMLHAIEKHKVTHFLTGPPILIEIAKSDETAMYDTSSLVEVLFTGAPLAPDILRRLKEELKFPLAQQYGLTEVENISFCQYTRDCASTIGTVSPGVEVKIVDSTTCQECPANHDGEICARGPQVMKGYLKNPEITSKTIDKKGWLHTGDLGRLDEKGRLFLTGRIKELIKYKGLQVAPAELESILLKHPKVVDAGVIGITDSVDGELPKAFVVKKCESLTKQEINSFVKNNLADYKQLRGGIVFVKKIPNSESGKILRNNLRQMEF